MQLELNTAEKLRDNWKYVLAEGLLPGLMQEGIVTVAFWAAINAGVEWRVYNGRADLRAIFRAYGETIAPATDFNSFTVSPATAFAVAQVVMQNEPGIIEALVRLNGGTMPEILPPVMPEPVEPEPEPEPEPEEEPMPEQVPPEEPPVEENPE